MHPTHLKSLLMIFSLQKTYTRNEFGIKMHYLAIYWLYPPPPRIWSLRSHVPAHKTALKPFAMCFSTPKTYRRNKLSTETHYLGTYSVHPYPMEPWGSGSLTLKHPTALKPFPTHVATPKTYRRDELCMKMHYLAICCLHFYPIPGGLMKFEVTHSNASCCVETIFNVFLDPENL